MYNGTKKLEQETKMFMGKNSIMECILALQTKNSEGFDRVPQRILVDGEDILIVAFEGLFSWIYAKVKVPAGIIIFLKILKTTLTFQVNLII